MFSIGSFTLGTLFGILISQILSHFLAKSREKESKFKEACVKLRASFADEIAFLHPHLIEGNEEDAHDVLKNAYPKHFKAINEFKIYLPKEKRIKFEEVWRKYYGYEDDDSMPFFEQYSKHIGSHDSYLGNCSLALSRINKIIEFTMT